MMEGHTIILLLPPLLRHFRSVTSGWTNALKILFQSTFLGKEVTSGLHKVHIVHTYGFLCPNSRSRLWGHSTALRPGGPPFLIAFRIHRFVFPSALVHHREPRPSSPLPPQAAAPPAGRRVQTVAPIIHHFVLRYFMTLIHCLCIYSDRLQLTTDNRSVLFANGNIYSVNAGNSTTTNNL